MDGRKDGGGWKQGGREGRREAGRQGGTQGGREGGGRKKGGGREGVRDERRATFYIAMCRNALFETWKTYFYVMAIKELVYWENDGEDGTARKE